MKKKNACNFDFLKNRTKFLSRETNFHHFSSMAFSGLKKMLISTVYIHMEVYQ